jgi:hypothetical protein
VLSNGVVTEAAWGVLNNATGVETTTDSLFQLESITKVYTATGQGVQEGFLHPKLCFLHSLQHEQSRGGQTVLSADAC